MTHAEQYSTSEPGVSSPARKKTRKRTLSILALATGLGLTSAVVLTSKPASADQIADAKAQAAAITAKIQATQAQIQTLTGQVTAADFRLSQLSGQIEVSQREMTKDKKSVNKDEGQLRVQAISDYTNSGTTNEITQMFSSNVDTSGIRSEYSSIATGNVTTTVDNLNTAQGRLQATENALERQKAQATAARDTLQSSENQANALVQQDQQTLAGVNATIQHLVAQQQAEEAAQAKAAAVAAFNAKLAAAQQAQAAAQAAQAASASSTSGGTAQGGGGGGSSVLTSAANPPPVPGGAAGAIQAAESQLGVPYVWGGETPGVGFDCSGLVQWSWEQAGVSLPRTSGAQFEATTQIPLADIEPGDLLFYGPDGSEHVAMYVGGGEMIEAPETGQVVHITGIRTGDGFAGVGRVN
jgi:cell wall-associated NlpC family hydrolase